MKSRTRELSPELGTLPPLIEPPPAPQSGDYASASDPAPVSGISPGATATPVRDSFVREEPRDHIFSTKKSELRSDDSVWLPRAPVVVAVTGAEAEGVVAAVANTQSGLQVNKGTKQTGKQRKPDEEGESIDLEAPSADSSDWEFHSEELPRLPSGTPSDAESDAPKKNAQRKAPVNEFCSGTFNGKWDMIDFAMAYHRFKDTDPAPRTVKPGNVTGYENEYEGRPKKKQRMTERDRIFWERVKKEEESGSGYELVDKINSAKAIEKNTTGYKLAVERFKAARAGGIHLNRVPSLMYPYAAELAQEEIAKLARSLLAKKSKGAPQSGEEQESAPSDADEEMPSPSESDGRTVKRAKKKPKPRPKVTATGAKVRSSTRVSQKLQKFGRWS